MLNPTKISVLLGFIGAVLIEGAGVSAFAQQTIRSIEAFQPKVKWGGRSVAVAQSGRINLHAIVASETGGLFKTTNGGTSWMHLDGLPPFRMSDVKYARLSADIVIATALRDSKVVNRAGIWRSVDGGLHWKRPATVDPPPGPGCPDRVSAYGISFQPYSNNVYVGTMCGLAVSNDLGATWQHSVLDMAKPAIFSVVASRSGRILTCGAAGVRLYSPQTQLWTSVVGSISACLPGATHTVDFSEEAQAFLVTDGFGALFKSDGQGSNWTALAQTPNAGGARRAPWVRVSPPAKAGGSLRLYFGDGVNLFRTTCSLTNPGLLCNQAWDGPLATGHSDPNDISFLSDECPNLVVTDGGVQRGSECGTTWTNVGPGAAGFNALQIYDLDGQILPDHTDLYFGTQDNGLWASPVNGLSWPATPFGNEGNGFVMERRRQDHGGRIIAWMQSGGIFSTTPHFASNLPWSGPPGNPYCTPAIIQQGVYAQFVNNPSTAANELYLTLDDGARWQRVLTVPELLTGCLQVSGPASKPVLYQPITGLGQIAPGESRIGLIRITGTIAGGPASYSRLNWPSFSSLGIFCPAPGAFDCPVVYAVSRGDPGHLIVPDVENNRIKVSRDGGQIWTDDVKLTDLVTAQGTLRLSMIPGEEGIRMQVHAIAFDPDNDNHILVGTEEAGIIESFDGGSNWSVIDFSNRVTAVSAFFFDRNNIAILSTYGRGLWKIVNRRVPPPKLCLNRPSGCRIEYTDSFEDRIPRGTCPHVPDLPTCQVVVALDGRIRDFSFDPTGNVEKIFFDGNGIGAFDAAGEKVPAQAAFTQAKPGAKFSNCPACVTVEKKGGAVRGLILGKSKLIGLVAEYPVAAPPELPNPGPGQGGYDKSAPFLKVIGESFAGGLPASPPGEEFTVHGMRFCSDPKCQGVTLLLNGRVVADNVKPGSDGTFKAKVVVKERPGFYSLTASQRGPAGKILSGVAKVLVPIKESEEKELFQLGR